MKREVEKYNYAQLFYLILSDKTQMYNTFTDKASAK